MRIFGATLDSRHSTGKPDSTSTDNAPCSKRCGAKAQYRDVRN
jgi:hypothetical protein